MYIYLLFIFAFLVRLINLNQSLWLDETIVAKVVKSIPFFQIPIQFSPGDFHPPLYYLFMSIWTSLFGLSEIALRMPSVLFCLLAGWYVYKIGGKWAAAFFLFNPLIIYFSQEARMYMMATALLTGALYHFFEITREIQLPNSNSSKKNSILFNIFSALAVGTFYGSIFFVVAMIVIRGANSKKKGKFIDWIPIFIGMTQLSIGLIMSILLLSPLLYQQAMNAKSSLVEVKNWSLVLGKAEIKNVMMIFLKFATGRLSWYPKWSYYLAAGIPTVLIWAVVLRGMIKNKSFAYLFILPLLFGLVISFWAPMMMYFRFLYLIPVMSLLLSVGLSKNQIGKMIVLSLFIIFSFLYLLIPSFHREDWKQLSYDLQEAVPVYMILPSSDPISYYGKNITVAELRSIGNTTLPEQIDVIPYTSGIYGFDYVQALQKNGCIKQSQSTFRGDLLLERWKCLRNA